MAIHLLVNGSPLCGFTSDKPADWPLVERWVGIDEAHLATCQACIDQLHRRDELNTHQAGRPEIGAPTLGIVENPATKDMKIR